MTLEFDLQYNKTKSYENFTAQYAKECKRKKYAENCVFSVL